MDNTFCHPLAQTINSNMLHLKWASVLTKTQSIKVFEFNCFNCSKLVPNKSFITSKQFRNYNNKKQIAHGVERKNRMPYSWIDFIIQIHCRAENKFNLICLHNFLSDAFKKGTLFLSVYNCRCDNNEANERTKRRREKKRSNEIQIHTISICKIESALLTSASHSRAHC